ncbi:MAG: hypothetical protein IT542_11815 [Rubellimicrobium sp.]|nr:hypothetical protein [Rubellimicrobium sp.]
MKLLDVQHPFFVPLWRRVAVVALCLGWALVEFLQGSAFWGMLFGAVGVYCIHQFFVAFDPPQDRGDPPAGG